MRGLRRGECTAKRGLLRTSVFSSAIAGVNDILIFILCLLFLVLLTAMPGALFIATCLVLSFMKTIAPLLASFISLKLCLTKKWDSACAMLLGGEDTDTDAMRGLRRLCLELIRWLLRTEMMVMIGVVKIGLVGIST